MHPRLMKHLAVAFAGGSAVLLACVVHEDTTFPAQPAPAETTPPTRFVVLDSGVVTLTGDGTGVLGIGGAGSNTPDAGELPDSGPEVATPDLGGAGSICDVFAQDPCKTTVTGLGCYYNPATDTAICDTQKGRDLPAGINCSPGNSSCGPQLACPNGICTNLCHYLQSSVAECAGSIGGQCVRLGPGSVGYCD